MGSSTSYGIGGYDTTKPANNVVADEVVVSPTADAIADLETKLTAAVAANKTFLALSSPTAAQVGAQVKSLTRQVNALLRLRLNALSDLTDS